METKSRTLEITILSAEDLRIHNKSVKKNAFIVVQTDSFNSKTTKMNGKGGSSPSWNDKLVMDMIRPGLGDESRVIDVPDRELYMMRSGSHQDMPMHTHFVTLQVNCKSSGGRDKTVGLVRIPVTDFIGGYSPETCLQFLSYRLRDPKRLKNRILNVSIRLKEPLQACSSQAVASGLGIPIDGRNDFGVVTGIPICSGYPSTSFFR
ncbi:BON1-associated protein 1 [Gossypium hirsutum]|uniref:BON1-associated protein 1 n=1 Tax=Gossypium hirsutum TaxID=3635 RepID=A0ABM2Z5G5_GOSHI|nr:BON1-associated protein 1-like [Gossypium hirsutum]